MLPLAVVIPTKNEGDNLRMLLPAIERVLESMPEQTAVYIVDGNSSDQTVAVAEAHGVTALRQRGKGYGGALRTAFEDIEAEYILTLDADFSHHPGIIRYLYAQRKSADICIASRYVPGGYAAMPWMRKMLSLVLNRVFRFVLSVDFLDMSSGFRLYKRSLYSKMRLEYDSYAILEEILIKALCQGYQVREIPFHYRPRREGKSHARVFKFGRDYLAVLWQLWKLRNSVASADYEFRAFHSRIPLQRWWQRRRYEIILGMLGDRFDVLDIGCGSTQLMNAAPQTIGMDAEPSKLRFLRRRGRLLVNGRVEQLPFRDQAFNVVVCSELIERVAADRKLFDEIRRLIRPGGSLILGTPDYGSWRWRLMEKVYDFAQPLGYAEQHISHYTRKGLLRNLTSMGFEIIAVKTIWKAEMIIHARLPENQTETPR